MGSSAIREAESAKAADVMSDVAPVLDTAAAREATETDVRSWVTAREVKLICNDMGIW